MQVEYLGSLARFRYFLISLVLLLSQVHETEARVNSSSTAAAVIGGIQLLSMLLIAAAVGGMLLVFLIYMVYIFIRRYIFKIQEPSKNFVMEKKVKCKSGETHTR